MALVLKDRVQQTGTANTTLSFTLSGSVTGYQSFSVVGDTNTTYYAATDGSGNWEAGIGTYSTTGPTLTRTTILSSSNSGSAVTFSGTVNVFLTYPSSRALYLDGASANINVSQATFTIGDTLYASATTTIGKLGIGTAGQALVVNSGATAPSWADQFLSITYIFSYPSASDQGDLTIPFNCTITEWTLLADANATSTTVVDIWKDTYANYPPTIADVITASAKPTIATSSNKGQSSTLTGWTTTITAGDTLRFNVNSVAGINRLTLSLKVKRT